MRTSDDAAAVAEVAPPAGTPALDCRGVTARYGRIEVCHGIDLVIHTSTIVALLGPNGAGKSSFLRGLAGTVAGEGTISVAGRRVDGLRGHQRARAGVALVPEGRGNCFPTLSVRDNLLLGGRLADAGDRDAAYDHVLDTFPILKRRLSQEAGTLSGGEQQMLAIGMALAGRPALILLDEPSQGLAPAILHQLRDVLHGLRSLDVGVLVAEQNQAFASHIADRFVVLLSGELTHAGGRDELRREALAAAYLSTSEDHS
jgi:branched-chain amino acid transport system ATP-binding protein